jgi:hypothetical protein
MTIRFSTLDELPPSRWGRSHMPNKIPIHRSKYVRPEYVKQRILARVILIFAVAMTACGGRETVTSTPTPHNTSGPTFNRITTSSKGFSIDCIPTSVTITADITDSSGITRAVLWYRVGTDETYMSVDMDQTTGNNYSATVKALDLPVGKYGALEFYVVAEDVDGNQAKSGINATVQLLPCVAN